MVSLILTLVGGGGGHRSDRPCGGMGNQTNVRPQEHSAGMFPLLDCLAGRGSVKTRPESYTNPDSLG